MISKRPWLVASMLGVALAVPARAAEPTTYRFGPESTVTYHVSHPLHHVVGVSRQLAGEVQVQPGPEPDLVLPIRLTVPIRSFDSGNRNRDRNMLQVMHAARYPQARLELQSVTWSSRRKEGDRTVALGSAKGALTLHGATRPVDVQLKGFVTAERLEVEAGFAIMLSEYAVERPSLLMRPVEDEVKLEIKGIALRP